MTAETSTTKASSVTAAALASDDDGRYLALRTRDARFDGRFFIGVKTTGIYCRPVCSVKVPRRENCRFFDHAAQAEHAGFRPCLRCRPELAPHSVVWSIQDAAYILAHQAARLLDEPDSWARSAAPGRPKQARAADAGEGTPINDDSPSLQALADRLGVSDRHMRRIFEAHFGLSPLQYLQTRRLLTAKQLLADTNLPIAQVAASSGFHSVRRFNAAFNTHYGLNPSQMRRADTTRSGRGTAVRLGYRPPYDVQAMLGFFRTRQIEGVEWVSAPDAAPAIARTWRIESAGAVYTGHLQASFDTARCQLNLQVSDSLHDVLPTVIRRVRAWLDLDADPNAIHAVLQHRFPDGAGLRVPGSVDGYELAVRAILGQQITVAAARTLARRLVQQFGEPVTTHVAGLDRLFPSPAALIALGAQAGDALGQLGIVRQRQAAIIALSQAVASGGLQLHASADVAATIAALKALPGIGDWTAQYIAMRALRWPDAFPAGDVALHKALGVERGRHAARDAEAASQTWKPWRSYAVLRAWAAPVAAGSPAAEAVAVGTSDKPRTIKKLRDADMHLPAQH